MYNNNLDNNNNSLLRMVVVVLVVHEVHEVLGDRDVVGRDGVLVVLLVGASLQQIQMFSELYSSRLPIHK